MEPLVSIIIPCYNAEAYVGEAIESALGQTYANTEVIVVDDGSTDGSVEVIRAFGDRVRWETGPNRGACAARNRGLELARGELIQFLDADDLLHPEKLERQRPLACRDLQRITFCDFVIQDGSTGQYVEVPRRPSGVLDPVCFAIAAQKLRTPAPLHVTSVLRELGGFDTALPCAQEYDLHIRLACAGLHFERLPEVLYTQRAVANSVSSNSVQVLDQHRAILLRAYDVLKTSGRLTDERARTIAGRLAGDARAYIRYGLYAKARDYFRLARQLHPGGGIAEAYSRPTRLLRRVVGMRWTERLVLHKRGFGRRAKSYDGDQSLQQSTVGGPGGKRRQ